MKRVLALALLLSCGGFQGCATAIIGGGGQTDQCEERGPRKCHTQENL